MTDKERFTKLQQDVLGATKHAIQVNASGLPLAALAAYIRQVGGDVLMVSEDMRIEDFKDKNPFRICVTTKIRSDFEKVAQIQVVDKVIGWG